jgi:acetylglutamate kinase
MRLVVKIGGAQLEERGARADFANDVRSALAAGHEIVLIHGGGNQIRSLSAALGLAERYHEGLRATDAATADVVLQVLAGLVNKQLVCDLNAAGVRAAGLCGADGGSFGARPMSAELGLGYVGTVAAVDPGLVETLLRAGFTPAVATCAPRAPGETGSDEHFYNINADLAVGSLSAALRADAILFLTDVEGVRGEGGGVIPRLDAQTAKELRERGVLRGGMIPKVDAALDASARLPSALVKIAPADKADSILFALSNAGGTAIVRGAFVHV